MKLDGFCDQCKRLRRVNVNSAALARSMANRGLPSGICDACQEEQERSERERWRRRR
jgi:hypothetical protein